jgi:Tol biopolymer transport system component
MSDAVFGNPPLMTRLTVRLTGGLLLLIVGLTLLLLFIGYNTPKQVIAFVSDRDGSNKLYLMDVRHVRTRRLSDRVVNECCLSWSPDGSQLVVPLLDAFSGRLYRINRSGSEMHLLTNDAVWNDSSATWSPDGQEVAFVRNHDFTDWEILVTDLASSTTRQLTDNRENDVWPLWSLDKHYLYYAASRGNENAIYRIRPDGEERQLLTSKPLYFSFVTLSPDGTTILYNGADPIGYADIYIMNTDGTGERALTRDSAINNFPLYSPDGERIVFVSNRDGDEEIFVMRADGGDQQQLTFNDAMDWLPSWSPDGQQIVFLSFRDGNTELYVMDADGHNERRLTSSPSLDTYPAWQP